jgi:hypothetical protein
MVVDAVISDSMTSRVRLIRTMMYASYCSSFSEHESTRMTLEDLGWVKRKLIHQVNISTEVYI